MIFSFSWFRSQPMVLVCLSLGPRHAPAVGRLADVTPGHGAAHAPQLQTAAGHGDTCTQLFSLQLQIFYLVPPSVWGGGSQRRRGGGAPSAEHSTVAGACSLTTSTGGETATLLQ